MMDGTKVTDGFSAAAPPVGRRTLERVFKTVIPHARAYGRWFLLAYLALLAGVGVNLLKPWPLKIIIDNIILEKPAPSSIRFLDSFMGHDPLALLAIISAGIVMIYFLEGLLSFTRKYFMAGAGESTMNDLRQHVFAYLQVLGRDRAASGDVAVRLTSDLRSLDLLLTQHLQNLVTYAVTFIAVALTMLFLDWRMTLLALVVVPPLYALSLYFSGRVKSLARQRQEKESKVAGLVEETVASKEVIQAFAREEHEKRRFARESNESLKATLGSLRLTKGFERAVQVTIAVGTALVIYYGARQALLGTITPGILIVFTAYLRDLYKPVGELSTLAMDITSSLVSGERIAEILESDPRVTDSPKAGVPPRFRGEVFFDRVTFGYERGKPVLQELSFTAKPGQKVSLIGSSGTGKTTIFNLLLRFYDPWNGRILVDGEDIRQYKIKSLREQISVVLQETLLFRRTIRDNIAYGNLRAPFEEIVAAAKAAQAHDFILKLPRKYDTLLREGGAELSGGQRQRIALARSILKNTPILVLDEPVAGLDAATEAKLNETLFRLMEGKTSFVVAHRFLTVRKSDLILIIEEGQVIEQGTHEELLSRSGLYRRLYHLQTLEPAGKK